MQTADGRDLTAATWRTIPEFPKYQITPDGDIRNRRTGRPVKEHRRETNGAYSYSLRRDDGTKTSRNYASLLRDAYPEENPA
jgi:hypothetical protein